MKVSKNTVVKIDYIVVDSENQLIDKSDDNGFEILIGHKQIVPGLEKALLDHEVGAEIDAIVTPEEGYGVVEPALVQTIDKSMFEGMELNVGDTFLADTDLGKKPIVVKEITGDQVVVDGNHPLAGKTLKFKVEILDVREATESEIEHGHVHGAHGCCHGHHHDEDHECCHGHHHDEDHECCHGHHHDEDHECCHGHHHEEHEHDGEHKCCCHHHEHE